MHVLAAIPDFLPRVRSRRGWRRESNARVADWLRRFGATQERGPPSVLATDGEWFRAATESTSMRFLAFVVAVAALTGCATPESPPAYRPLTAAEGRALVGRLLPDSLPDRSGWATDIFAAIAALDIAPTRENICAVIAIAEQESGLRADPAVPGLSTIAWREIDKERERAGVPRIVLDAALALRSPDGSTYRERLDAVKTERQLSDIFEDFIGMAPLAKTFLAERNPVRTGGPMQVDVAFAETHAASKPYPYAVADSIRHEVFTRRGGLYFGTAHLLGYPARYDRYLYRFADFNAGWYASRNAAFQDAVTQASGVPLALDGDLLRYDRDKPLREPSGTELATRVLARRLQMSDSEIRRDLELGKTARFETSELYVRVFALADRASVRRLPRAVVPQITLHGAKLTRTLTTEWFAQRVQRRYDTCLARLPT